MNHLRQLTTRFEEALTFTVQLHSEQKRIITGIPYISHLLSVAALVMEDGGDEDQVIAALLHDALEDQGRDGATRREIETRFGQTVLALVDACTETESTPNPPWRERKAAYLARIPALPPEALRIVMADKVHNTRSLLADLRTLGESVFNRFSVTKEETIWFYRALARAFTAAGGGFLAHELDRTICEIEVIVNATPLEKAIRIAATAHSRDGQKDKANAPYLLHPLRVMLRTEGEPEMIAAVLHDVIEDTDVTFDDLRREGIPEAVLDAVACLTKSDGEDYEAFIRRAQSNPIAARVKRADLEDNMDIKRMGELSEKDLARLNKYLRAWRAIKD